MMTLMAGRSWRRLSLLSGICTARSIASLSHHSIVQNDGNSLIYQRNFFQDTTRTVSPIRQKFALLNSNTNFDGPWFARLQQQSASIGRFAFNVGSRAIPAVPRKRP
jgi:hypothetical protein